jgi:hypothetical protein
MRAIQFSSIVGVVAVAACARSLRSIGSGDLLGDDGGGISSGASSSGSTPGGGEGPHIEIPGAGDDAGDGGLGDGSAVLAENGSGTCVSGRSCDPTCDQLIENGQHEYNEPMPDDGSQIPFANLAAAHRAFSATPATSGGPCIVEPPDGALFPNNWVRARIRYKPTGTSQTFQIRIHASRQMNDLVVYTKSTSWKIPKDIWTALAASTWGENITVTVTASGTGGGAPASSTTTFQIAPALANGTVIYWAAADHTKKGAAWLESFSVGDENAAIALTVPQAKWQIARDERGNLQTRAAEAPLNLTTPGSTACIGCHVAVPDRASVTYIEDWPWDGVSAMIDPLDTGKLPSWLTVGGSEALSMPWLGMMTFSQHVWTDLHQHVMVVAMQNEATWNANAPVDGGAGQAPIPPWGYQGGNEWDQAPASELGWIDLSSPAPSIFTTGAVSGNGDSMSLAMAANYGTSWGIIARGGDPAGVASPTWSHVAGDRIVYASTNASRSGREGPSTTQIKGFADLWSVPYGAGAGGLASPIPGASDPNWNEYYPTLSPDDAFIAYNRTPAQEDMYYAPNGEVYVVAGAGGTPTRLAANDPPACMGVRSPGVTNSWPKWSPEYPKCHGQTYYWLIFSSAREQTPFSTQQVVTSQLYLTALTANESGPISFPGIFIWNQHTKVDCGGSCPPGVAPYVGNTQSNHTPQWEGIDLPPPPPPPPPPPKPPPPPT